ncbi:MAG: hypothetical protein ACF8PN_08190 [Phycisphaerales bacterium]
MTQVALPFDDPRPRRPMVGFAPGACSVCEEPISVPLIPGPWRCPYCRGHIPQTAAGVEYPHGA